MARTSEVGVAAVAVARRTASPSDADGLLRDLYAEHGPALLRLTTALTGGNHGHAEDLVQESMLWAWNHRDNSITATCRWPKRRGYCRSLRARSDHAPSTGYARYAALWQPTMRPRSGGWLVLQRTGQLMAA